MLQSVRHTLRGALSCKPTPTQNRCARTTNHSFHKDYNAAREEQTFKLSDGRTMGYAEYGKVDGTPTFFLHGAPGSRYDGMALLEPAEKFDLRVICPDRPGHGLSTYQHDRNLGDYPSDIAQLARHLSLPPYHVIGQSGGGPYVVACAYGLPKDELLTATVIAGMGHFDCVTVKDAGLYTVMTVGMAKRMPSLMQALSKWLMANDDRIQKQLNFAYKLLPKDDRGAIADPEAQPIIIKTLKEAYAQGAAGTTRDAQIYGSPWDFELKDVQKHVKLFYGRKDVRTPIAFGRHYKEHLPSADLIELDGMSHFNTDRYNDEVFAGIFGNRKPKQSSEVNGKPIKLS